MLVCILVIYRLFLEDSISYVVPPIEYNGLPRQMSWLILVGGILEPVSKSLFVYFSLFCILSGFPFLIQIREYAFYIQKLIVTGFLTSTFHTLNWNCITIFSSDKEVLSLTFFGGWATAFWRKYLPKKCVLHPAKWWKMFSQHWKNQTEI